MNGRPTCAYSNRVCNSPNQKLRSTQGSSDFSSCNNTVCAAPFAQLQSGLLNPQAYKTAIDFTTCNGVDTKTTRDARLFDMPRTQRFGLDSAPADSSVYMDDVYNPELVPESYNRPYTGYSDITPGDIRYYIDPDVAPAFRGQIYNMDGITRVDMFTTPMDKVEPMFYLQPVQSTHNNISKDTFCRDQLAFRNDLISLQQRGHNKTRYEALK